MKCEICGMEKPLEYFRNYSYNYGLSIDPRIRCDSCFFENTCTGDKNMSKERKWKVLADYATDLRK